MLIEQGFGVRAFGVNICVEADSPDALAVLDRYIFTSLPRVDSARIEPDLSVRIAQAAGEFHLLCEGSEVASATDAAQLIPHLFHVLDDIVIRRLAPLKAVHAGAVVWGGKAILLPGSTHSGKSSLVAELLRNGAAYLSDEYALIDAQGMVHAYPRPILARDRDGFQSARLPGECGAQIADAPVRVGWVLTLAYDPEASWAVDEVSQSVALISLLRNTPHAMADSPEMLPAFERAVAGAVCFMGRRGDAPAAAAAILELIAGRS
jgi:hypothetical protein